MTSKKSQQPDLLAALPGELTAMAYRPLKVWRRLTRPSPAIQDPEHYRRAQLLCSLLLVLLLVSILSLAADLLMNPDAWRDALMGAVGAAALIGVYVLSRTRYYTAGAAAFVGILFLIVHAAPLAEDGSSGWLFYAILPILLTGILFSIRMVFVVTGASIGTMLLLIAFVEKIDLDTYMTPVMFTAIAAATIITFMHYRNQVEKDRQASLRQSHAALEASEARWRVLVDESPDVVYSVKMDETIEFFNRDTPDQSVIGKSIYAVMPPETRGVVREGIRWAVTSGEREAFETVTANGQWFLHRANPVKRDDVVVGLVLTVSDITEQKQAEAERVQLQQQIIESQQQSLRELSTPIIPVAEGIIIMPLIGVIDTTRAKDITRALLDGINRFRAQTVILDITGVPVVDGGVAGYLNKAVRAARLKGVHIFLTGISDAVAETIVDLGIDWSGIETLRDLQSGLATATRDLNRGTA